MYDVLLKNALVIDPSRDMRQTICLALKDGKIAALEQGLSEDESLSTFDLKGKIVVPGLIDIHCHLDSDFSHLGLPPDEIGVANGITTLCDAGTSGCANFRAFKKCVDHSCPVTDYFAFLNIGATGLIRLPEIQSPKDMDFENSKKVIEDHFSIIKGVKLRLTDALAENVGINAVETAKKLAGIFNLPLMVHLGETRDRKGLKDPLDELSRAAVELMEKGDILSHYLTWEPGGLILKDGTVYPELEQAHRRGVVLDSCHGLNHFSFDIAKIAIEQGLLPGTISTDMATIVRPAAQSLAVIMSKFMMLGLSLEQVIEMTTLNPAVALKEENNRGCLKEGVAADITVIEEKKGMFKFMDRRAGKIMDSEVLLEPYMVFKAGKPFPAWSGYQLPRKDLIKGFWP